MLNTASEPASTSVVIEGAGFAFPAPRQGVLNSPSLPRAAVVLTLTLIRNTSVMFLKSLRVISNSIDIIRAIDNPLDRLNCGISSFKSE